MPSLPNGELRIPTRSENVSDCQEDEEGVTDVEEVADPCLSPKSKLLSVPVLAEDGVTDSEEIVASGEDEVDEFENEDARECPDIFSDLKNEVVNQTDGFKENRTSAVSDEEIASNVYLRHSRNLKKTEETSQDDANEASNQIPTDFEDMSDTDEDAHGIPEEIETKLPNVYCEHVENVVNSEVIKPIDLTCRKSKRNRKYLKIIKSKSDARDNLENLTDTEDLEDHKSVLIPSTKVVPHSKIRKRKAKNTKSKLVSLKKVKSLSFTNDDDTDSECLIDEQSDSEYENSSVNPNFDTDDEVYNADSCDDISEFQSPPVVKETPSVIPMPHNEVIDSTETDNKVTSDAEQCNTDEEDFSINKNEDNCPLPELKYEKFNSSEEVQPSSREESEDEAQTDDDELDVEANEKSELMRELCTWKEAVETDILEKMDFSSGTESKIGKWKDAIVNVMKTTQTIKSIKSLLPSNLSFDGIGDDDDGSFYTDEEDIDGDGNKVDKEDESKTSLNLSGTGSENVTDSEDDNASYEFTSREESSKLSELRFLECGDKQLSIIVTQDHLNDPSIPEIADNIPGVAFLDDDDEGNQTDVENIDEPERISICVNPASPLTDSEEFLDERSDICRPETPIPAEIEFSVLSSPKRERIYIREDKYGVPQVEIEKMDDDFLSVEQSIERPRTATEDVEITLEEALRIFGVKDCEKETCNLGIDCSEVNERIRHKINKISGQSNISRVEDATDEEEVILRKKRHRRTRSRPGDDDNTDTEILSGTDECSSSQKSKNITPVISTDEDTGDEDLEVSALEDIVDEPCYPFDTPEIVRKVAVKRTEIYREGPDHTTGNVIIEPAQIRNETFDVPSVTTDTDEMEGSATDDCEQQATEGCNGFLREAEDTRVVQSHDLLAGKVNDDDPDVKTNLLYASSRPDANTDIESIEDVDRCE